MELCGKCLHDKEAHTVDNGHFMRCNACFKLCDIEEFRQVHKWTSIEKIMEIGARKQ